MTPAGRRPERPHRPAATGGEQGVRTLALDIPSDVREIERVVDLVRRECEAMHFAARQLMLNVPVALTEALSNAIIYGNADDPDKRVRVNARIDRTGLVVEIIDEGSGFDLDLCTIDPTTPDRIEHEDGRGLYLMRQLMDEVQQVPGHPGNLVRLVLRRAS